MLSALTNYLKVEKSTQKRQPWQRDENYLKNFFKIPENTKQDTQTDTHYRKNEWTAFRNS